MLTLKNTGKGPRAVLLTSGRYEFFQPGEQKAIRGELVRGIPADLIEIALEAQDAGDVPEQPQGLEDTACRQDLAHFDHDGDGCPGGSKPHDPPALSAMTRAELEQELAACGLDIDQITGSGKNGAVVMADIRDAIEAYRARGAQ